MFDPNLKIIFATLASIFAIAAYFPYLKEMLGGRTKPHMYTWLIWTITTGTAAAGLWYGGGGYGALGLTVSTFLTFLIFLLSFTYGTKNVTQGDVAILLLALSAIIIWWLLNSPLLAVLMVTAIDAIGYLPSFRKSFNEPWSEPILSWILFTLAPIFGLLALSGYTLLTTTYLLMCIVANILMITLCFLRRPLVQKPQP
ncbi:MAG: hypothetical protein V4437_03235 [Patescibacteria group bacterium]